MITGSDSVFQLTKQALDAASLRQTTISHNVSNVNTKGYKAKAVEFETYLNHANGNKKIQMLGNHDRHYGLSSSQTINDAKVIESKSSTKMNVDGNNVDIDYEMMNMAANQIKYNALIRQASEKISNYRYVIKEGR